jgi:hypothetical protein
MLLSNFDNPFCQSDPTHSFLSKDHFVRDYYFQYVIRLIFRQNLILNEPAGHLAKIVLVCFPSVVDGLNY